MYVYADAMEKFIILRQYIQEVETCFYCHCLLRYILNCALAGTDGTLVNIPTWNEVAHYRLAHLYITHIHI